MEVVDSYVSPNVSRNYMWKAKKEKPDGNLVHGLIPKFRYLTWYLFNLRTCINRTFHSSKDHG